MSTGMVEAIKAGIHGCGTIMFTDKWLLAHEFNLIHEFKWDSIGMGAQTNEKQCAHGQPLVDC